MNAVSHVSLIFFLYHTYFYAFAMVEVFKFCIFLHQNISEYDIFTAWWKIIIHVEFRMIFLGTCNDSNESKTVTWENISKTLTKYHIILSCTFLSWKYFYFKDQLFKCLFFKCHKFSPSRKYERNSWSFMVVIFWNVK